MPGGSTIGPITGLLADLIRIDSVNPGLVPGSPGEGAIVALLRERLTASGWHTKIIEAMLAPGRPSLVAHPSDLDPDRPVIVLNGHLDTVGVEGMTHPFDPRVDGERMVGRGTCDMLGGVAALILAAEQAARHGAPVVLALVADEEDRSLGAEAVLAALPELGIRPEVCLVAEPTWLRRCTSLRGYAVAEVVFTGRASHTSLPDEGVNAVSHLARFVTAIDARATEVRARGGELLVSVAGGGRAPFSIPDTARATVERRTAPGEPPDAIVDDVEAVLDALRAADAKVSARHTLRIARPAWELDADGPAGKFADRLETELASRGVAGAESFAAPYWMEAALWEASGIPSLVCGPAGGGLHSADEWVDLRQVAAFAEALTATLIGWSGAADQA